MTISELKAIIDALAELHPDANVDVAYPVTFRGALTTRVSFVTGYRVYGADGTKPTVRLVIKYAREPEMGEQ